MIKYALLGLLLALPLSTAAQAAVPPTPPGWTLAWSDDFTGPNNSAPNPANWIVDTGHGYPGGPGNWGTGEIQRYTNDRANLRLDGKPIRVKVEGRWLETGRRKLGAVLGDQVETGCNSVTNPGTLLGRGSLLLPCQVAVGYHPARSRIPARP